MSKHARRPPADSLPFAIPALEDCLFHRCPDHEHVRQLNESEVQTGSECGACLAEEVTFSEARLLNVLEGYADRLAYAAHLKSMLASARDRLELLSPGAGAEFTIGDRNG